MSSRQDGAADSALRYIGRVILDLPRRITEPSKSIVKEIDRRKARFLSIALFTATAVYPILQITSEVTRGIPYYSGSTFFLAALYLLSRTEHIRLATTLTIIFTASFPFLILILNPIWTAHNLAFQILTWPVLAVLMGSQLLPKVKETLLIIGISGGLVIVCLFHPGMIFSEAIELVAASFAIQALLGIINWTNEYYSQTIEENNRMLETRRQELEIYTSLLRHDLSNDIQMVLGGLELSQMTIDEPKKHSSFIDSTLAAAKRMKSLIHIFSASEDELDKDILSILQLISKRAQIAFKGMLVNLEVDKSVADQQFYFSKLIAMAFENLLRNTAQHAGNNPNVTIRISLDGNMLDIMFEDDGPGISDEIREHIFGKGVTTGSKGRGLGLYLTKTIIESEGGNINLVENGRQGCCFHIQLPIKIKE